MVDGFLGIDRDVPSEPSGDRMYFRSLSVFVLRDDPQQIKVWHS